MTSNISNIGIERCRPPTAADSVSLFLFCQSHFLMTHAIEETASTCTTNSYPSLIVNDIKVEAQNQQSESSSQVQRDDGQSSSSFSWLNDVRPYAIMSVDISNRPSRRRLFSNDNRERRHGCGNVVLFVVRLSDYGTCAQSIFILIIEIRNMRESTCPLIRSSRR